jgi:hypothetical protein
MRNIYIYIFGESNFTELFFIILFYLQSVPVHSNSVKTYIVACRRVLSKAPL